MNQILQECYSNIKKINISNVVERAVEFYKMSDKNLNLKKIIDKKQNFSIKGDSDQLYRVFLNLIKNSIEAIEKTKIRIYKVKLL